MINPYKLTIGITGSSYIIYKFIRIKNKIGSYSGNIENYSDYKKYIYSDYAKSYLQIVSVDNWFPIFYGLIYYELMSIILYKYLALLFVCLHCLLDWLENLYQYQFTKRLTYISKTHYNAYRGISKIKKIFIFINTLISILGVFRMHTIKNIYFF